MRALRIVLIFMIVVLAPAILITAREQDEHRQVAVCTYELKMLDGADSVDLNDALQFCQERYDENPLIEAILAKWVLFMIAMYVLLTTSLLKDCWLTLKTFIETGLISRRGQ